VSTDAKETNSPSRILELWPHLSSALRAELIATAERLAAPGHAMEPPEFTDEELAAIEQGQEDFRQGRTLTLDEFDARTAKFLESLRIKSTSV
jgi:hypothetical protein